LTIDDWKLADAMYRSRALELPKSGGDAMVPVLDMANHAFDDHYNARFDIDEKDGSVVLIVREGKTVSKDDEVTIMYGAGGACEMIFSYGFVEEDSSSAREMYLGLSMLPDDPLRRAKTELAREAPGVRLFVDGTGKVQWDSLFVWWACVNEEDGLDFQVLQTNEGGRELKALWKGAPLGPSDLRSTLQRDERADVFLLRAIVLVQQRVESQGMALATSDDSFEQAIGSKNVGQQTWRTIKKLRELELELLTASFEMLEEEASIPLLPCKCRLTLTRKNDCYKCQRYRTTLGSAKSVRPTEQLRRMTFRKQCFPLLVVRRWPGARY